MPYRASGAMLFPHVNIVTVAVFAALLLGFFVVSRISAHRKRQREMAALGETWGQPRRRGRAERSVAARTPSTAPPGTTRLDEVTWSDLDMARVFTRIDRTLTSIGAQMLHRMLRCPAIDPETIERRGALVVAVAADPDARTRMQRVLVALGDKHGWEAWFALSGALPILPGPVWLLQLLPLMMLGTLGAAIMLDHLLLFIAAVVLGLALPLVHAVTNRTIGHHLEAVADVGRVLLRALFPRLDPPALSKPQRMPCFSQMVCLIRKEPKE